jgi:ribosome biogenesis protein ERB1
VRLWEVETGRCFRTWRVGGIVECLAFCPVASTPLLAVAVGPHVLLLHTHTGSDAETHDLQDLLVTRSAAAAAAAAAAAPQSAKTAVQWRVLDDGVSFTPPEERKDEEDDEVEVADPATLEAPLDAARDAKKTLSAVSVVVGHHVKTLTWHHKGDYFATVSTDTSARAVLIHRISQRQSQCPFAKAKGIPQCVLFHPDRPFFLLARCVHGVRGRDGEGRIR